MFVGPLLFVTRPLDPPAARLELVQLDRPPTVNHDQVDSK